MSKKDKDFKNNSSTDTDIDTVSINEVLNELGIRSSNDDVYKLILWNDHVNNMIHVIVSLCEVCKITESEATRIMLEAHEKGKALVKKGYFDEMNNMKIGLNDRNLEATVE